VKRTFWFISLALVLATPAIALTTEDEVESVTVEIRSRMFIPQHVHVHHDRKTVLRFRSHDTELHTVVAKELFLSADLNVGGNGAPEPSRTCATCRDITCRP
jgi:hypothetical protein